MVKIYINGREWVGEEDLIASLARSKQVVRGIEIDRQEYSGSLEEVLHEKGAREMQIEPVSLAELLEETKASVKNYLPILRDSMYRVAHLFQSGQDGEACSLAVGIIDGLEWTTEAITNINLLVPNFLPEEGLDKFKSKVRDLLKAWERNDYVLVGDLFEYELAPLLAGWEMAFSREGSGKT